MTCQYRHDTLLQYIDTLNFNADGLLVNPKEILCSEKSQFRDILEFCCAEYYPRLRTGLHMTLAEAHDNRRIEQPNQLVENLVPISDINYQTIDLLLKKLLLYTDKCVIVMPINYRYWIDDDTGEIVENAFDIKSVLEANYRYSTLVKSQEVIFLPKTMVNGMTGSFGTDNNGWERLEAPFKQSSHSFRYIPYNAATRQLNNEFFFFDLPFLQNISLENLIKIKRSETDAFQNFRFIMRKKIRELSNIQSHIALKELIQEIEHETKMLRLEIEKIRKMKMCRDIGIGMFFISLVALAFDYRFINTVAGLIASKSLFDIFQNHEGIAISNKRIKNDYFYIPYILAAQK